MRHRLVDSATVEGSMSVGLAIMTPMILIGLPTIRESIHPDKGAVHPAGCIH